jgi:hypothetical protein
MSVRIQGHRCHDGYLVLRTATGGAVREFAAQVGGVDLDVAHEGAGAVALDHRLYQFVLDQPSGRVADAQRTFQREGGQSGLGLADQIDRQKPHGQSQMGALEQGARDEERLWTWQTRLPLEVIMHRDQMPGRFLA